MSDKKISLCKPSVPVRPKNLIVLNSKHLPKPPETFVSNNVTKFIKDLNLDVKDEGNVDILNKGNCGQQSKNRNALENSDAEDDIYGYLEPVCLSSVSLSNGNTNGKTSTDLKNQKKHESLNESSTKGGEVFGRHTIKTDKNVSDVSDVEEQKITISQSQWQRPLPSLPVLRHQIKSDDVTLMPWYKNVDRKKGEEILKNGVDGYFMVRPSSNVDTYLTLTLWYSNRVYNIPIRRRKDGKFALGTPKSNEQSFESVEYLIQNYQSEKLVLYSGGVQTGKTLLTTFPS